MTQDCQRLVKTWIQTAARGAAVFLCWAYAVCAEDVTITTTDGGLTLTGRVVSYDGALLQLDSAYGLMTLRYDEVICDGVSCPDPDTFVPLVRLSGAARMGEVMVPALIDAFARAEGYQAETVREDAEHLTITLSNGERPQARFALRLSNTDEGFADLIAFEADVVMAMREVRAEEAERASLVGLGDITSPRQARIIGFDALVPLVNPAMDLRHVALRDVARAYRGEITNWAELGGPEGPISLHLGPRSGGPWQFFVDQIVRQGGQELSETVIRHDSARDVALAVATTPGGLGMLPYGETANGRAVALRDACGFTAVPLNVTLKTQDYPLTEPLFLYAPDRRHSAVIRSFFAFLRGPEAQLVVRRAGFVDQGAVPIPLDAQGQRFANAIDQAGAGIQLDDLQRMVRVLTPRTRLSTSFRFVEGSDQLDAASRSNLMALGQAIRNGRYADQRLMLVGFGAAEDADGFAFDQSLRRAETVKADLIAALGRLPGDVDVETAAFGAALPMGCNDTPWGRQRNNRVELWVDQG
ncbi:MAG: substrate-binding domain-containing protein [Pseudomonadota bacterium]